MCFCDQNMIKTKLEAFFLKAVFSKKVKLQYANLKRVLFAELIDKINKPGIK